MPNIQIMLVVWFYFFGGGGGECRVVCPLKHKKRASCPASKWGGGTPSPLPLLALHINSVCLDPFYRSEILCKHSPPRGPYWHITGSALKEKNRL